MLGSVGAETHAEILKFPQNLRLRHGLVSDDLVEKHELRNHECACHRQKQQQCKAPSLPQPAEHLPEAMLLQHAQLAHRALRRRPRLRKVSLQQHKTDGKVVRPLRLQKCHTRAGQLFQRPLRACPADFRNHIALQKPDQLPHDAPVKLIASIVPVTVSRSRCMYRSSSPLPSMVTSPVFTAMTIFSGS